MRRLFGSMTTQERRDHIFAALLNLLQCTAPPVVTDDGVPRKFLRFAVGPNVSYGVLEGDRVRRIDGNLFGDWQAGSKTYALSEIELLVPTIPSKVLAMAFRVLALVTL